MSAQENEKEAVRTTIVGGRPPGSGRSNLAVPRGIEVLVKKAAVDPEFRELLLDQRGRAAAAIELELDPAENAMLSAIPQEQLAQIVGQTVVPMEQRRAFLGRFAAAMLAVLGIDLVGCKQKTDAPVAPAGIQPDLPQTNKPPAEPSPTNAPLVTQGIQPDRPYQSRGVRPDRP